MRDPLGAIAFEPAHIQRTLHQPLPESHFLRSEAARALVARGWLVPFEIASAHSIRSPRVPFVTYPHEWCNAQFVDAAELTLAVSEAVLEAGAELKDGSAWNVIFDGCKPVFCDHLSFQTVADKRWWAFAQYVRHFILPLCLAKYRGLHASASMAIARDGMDPDMARQLMGWRRFVTRYWLLLLRARQAPADAPAPSTAAVPGATNHRNLYAMTRWLLDGVRKLRRPPSTWVNYTDTRGHYSARASDVKYRTVGDWLARLAPAWVIDLGCNTGEFSRLAADAGASVVAIDLDHESVQTLYLANQGRAIYPVLANVDDLSGGRGWDGREFPGLAARLEQHGDLLLMLAVLHHVAISSGIPYPVIAASAARMTRRFLIVEMLDAADPLVRQLAAQRNRDPEEFSIERQRAAFAEHFTVLETVAIPESSRQLLLMEKNERA